MKIKNLFVPKSPLGWGSPLSILLLVLFYILQQAIKMAQGPVSRPTFWSDPLHAILLILAWLSGTAAFILGLMAIIKNKERAIPVFVAALLGLLVMLFGIGEVISPH